MKSSCARFGPRSSRNRTCFLPQCEQNCPLNASAAAGFSRFGGAPAIAISRFAETVLQFGCHRFLTVFEFAMIRLPELCRFLNRQEGKLLGFLCTNKRVSILLSVL